VIDHDRNIVLIGMPGVGKSTVGVLLAKATGRGFHDTDEHMQARERRRLQAILDAEGLDAFCRLEQAHVLELDLRAHVIATGGSVVYSEAAMERLRTGGESVYLRAEIAHLAERIDNLATRGVVIARGQTLADLYAQRRPLYERWAQVTVDCDDKTQDQVVAEIMGTLVSPPPCPARPDARTTP